MIDILLYVKIISKSSIPIAASINKKIAFTISNIVQKYIIRNKDFGLHVSSRSCLQDFLPLL